jgi:hypothetical protein
MCPIKEALCLIGSGGGAFCSFGGGLRRFLLTIEVIEKGFWGLGSIYIS